MLVHVAYGLQNYSWQTENTPVWRTLWMVMQCSSCSFMLMLTATFSPGFMSERSIHCWAASSDRSVFVKHINPIQRKEGGQFLDATPAAGERSVWECKNQICMNQSWGTGLWWGNTFWYTRNNNTHPEPSSVLLTHTTNMLLQQPKSVDQTLTSIYPLEKLRSEGLARTNTSLLANVIAIPPV